MYSVIVSKSHTHTDTAHLLILTKHRFDATSLSELVIGSHSVVTELSEEVGRVTVGIFAIAVRRLPAIQ